MRSRFSFSWVSGAVDQNLRCKSARAGLGLALFCGSLLWGVGAWAAAEPTCLGQWHFELVLQVPASEDYLREDSWCRAKNLPRALDVQLLRGNEGRVDISGSPYRPVDVLRGGGRCEFKFEGKESGMPESYGLSFEVDGAALAVFGKGVCSVHGPWAADGTRSGVSVGLLVKATHGNDAAAPAPQGPPAADSRPSPAPPHDTWPVISGPGFRMLMPLAFEPDEEPVTLPCGQARETVRRATDDFTNTTYLFGTYDWPKAVTTVATKKVGTKIDETGLRKVRAYFLRNRGCVAHDLRTEPLSDKDGKLWPQTAFEGSCKGGDSFRAVFLLVNGSLYHFQAVHLGQLSQQATLPLDEALVRLVGSFSGDE